MQDEVLQKILNTYKVGQAITYKNDICQILGVEYSTRTNIQKSHMKSIQQFMKLEEVGKGKGKKYVIVEIYDTVRERDDKRKDNGQNENSLKALEQNRYIKPRTIPLELLHAMYSFIHLQEVASHISLEELLFTDTKYKTFTVQLQQNDIRKRVGLGNDYTTQLLLNKVDMIQQPHYYDEESVIVAMNNLYSSMKNKILCDLTVKTKLIYYKNENDTYYLKATESELEEIATVESDIISKYNDKFDTNYKYNDVYSKFNKSQRKKLQNRRRDRLMDIFSDEKTYYIYDTTSLCITSSIVEDIATISEWHDLEYLLYKCERVGTDIKEVIDELMEQLQREIFQLFYDNEVERINKHYDELIANHEENHKRSFGHGYKTHINDKRRGSLELLDLCVKSDLTSKDIMKITHLIED